MALYRCAACGSSHVVADTKKEGFSVSKAVVGTALFGTAGAVMGVNGKEQIYYHCAACGQTLSYPMLDVKKNFIDKYLLDPEKYQSLLADEKKQYPNIEWEDSGSSDVVTARDIVIDEEKMKKRLDVYGLVEMKVTAFLEGDVIKNAKDLYKEAEISEICPFQVYSSALRRMVSAGILERDLDVDLGKNDYALKGTIERVKEKERAIALEEARNHNKKLEEQIVILQKERAEQETIIDKNSLKFWGEGAQAKKDAKNRIAEIDYEIGKLRNDMKPECLFW